MQIAKPRGLLLPILALVVLTFPILIERGSEAQQKEKDVVESVETSAGVEGLPAVKNRSFDAAPVQANRREAESFVSFDETEPNGTAATATLISHRSAKVRATIYPSGDVDFYSFYAGAGDRVYAATMTSTSTSSNSVLTLLASDGTTVLETDDDDGSFSTTSSSIAGREVPSAGVYYLRVTSSTATTNIRPYDLYLQVQSGSPAAETEPNDDLATANAMPANRFVSGAITSGSDAADYFSFQANAGDTVFLSLDLDPERDGTTWNGTLGVGTFNNFVLLVNDASTTSPNSEAHFMTVKQSGTYYARVAHSTSGSGSATSTYNLSVSVISPREQKCTTYTTADAAEAIGPDTTSPPATQTITVPDNFRISKATVSIDLTHALMVDVDIRLTSPNSLVDVALFNDVGATTANQTGLTEMNVTLDDDAALPITSYTVQKPVVFHAESFTRLSFFNDMNSQGVWTLRAYDDLNGNSGTLNNWSLTLCRAPSLDGPDLLEQIVFSTDFEANDGGFTHSGTADEWEYGTPNTNVSGAAVINTCSSGTKCWKTDLDNTYDASSNQNLVSPAINLTNQQGRSITLTWAHKYQVENATFDHYWVEVREAGGSGMSRRVYEHLDNTMSSTVGNPTITVEGSVGWALKEANISDFAGKTIEVVFHLDSDGSVHEAGVAVDDVKVVALKSPPAADFDGNGGTDISVFRTNAEDGSDARWYILNGSDGSVTNQLFGLDTDLPATGDYDGDGDIDIAVFRASEGRWYISRGSRFDFDVIEWGTAGDVPVAADYDGDGRTDAAVFRPSNQTWYIRRSSDGTAEYLTFGLATDKLVARDYDGDGKADPAVFRNGTWYIYQSFYETVRVVQFGVSGDLPVAADYDGDRRADLAVFRPSEGTWYIWRSSNGSLQLASWGLASDIPVPGDYDRDRRTDLAVFRPSTGEWYILRSSDGTFFGSHWGISDDTPIPASF